MLFPYCLRRSYLELSDWELKDALQSAKEDREWEKEESHEEGLKAGQIGVRINFSGGKPLMNLKGIGKSTKEALRKQMKKVSRDDGSESPKSNGSNSKVKIYSAPPAIASKSVLAEDLFNVSSSQVLRVCFVKHQYPHARCDFTGCPSTQQFRRRDETHSETKLNA